jgi:uncharacterized damage-inducible protein DinB
MLEHSRWANERMYSHMKNTSVDKEVIELFYHIVAAEEVWLCRINHQESSHISLWGSTTLEDCEKMLKGNILKLEGLLHRLMEEDLPSVISYKNSKGKEYQSTIEEILTHIALHGQYHRGQINKKLRESGNEPVNVDFISYVRNEF